MIRCSIARPWTTPSTVVMMLPRPCMLRGLLMDGGRLFNRSNNRTLNKFLTLDEPPGDDFCHNFQHSTILPATLCSSHLPRLAAPPPGFVWWCSTSRCFPGTHRAMAARCLRSDALSPRAYHARDRNRKCRHVLSLPGKQTVAQGLLFSW